MIRSLSLESRISNGIMGIYAEELDLHELINEFGGDFEEEGRKEGRKEGKGEKEEM